MSINKKCPKCGSTKTTITSERGKHGFLWFILFGLVYGCWWLFKAMMALVVLICFDWWYALIQKSQGKGYVWLSKRMIQNSSRIYHCEKCGNNFRG